MLGGPLHGERYQGNGAAREVGQILSSLWLGAPWARQEEAPGSAGDVAAARTVLGSCGWEALDPQRAGGAAAVGRARHLGPRQPLRDLRQQGPVVPETHRQQRLEGQHPFSIADER